MANPRIFAPQSMYTWSTRGLPWAGMPATSDPAVALGPEQLYAVIGAVAQGPSLDRVLPAIVSLLTDATACHACFIYLREGDLLRMRAASTVFAHAVDRTVLGLDEGLCGWVATRRTPAFIRENALQDPRTKLVAELQEERFQSMIAVPLLDRDGEAIGVVALHTEAPREFGREVVDFLVHV
ncbi:MAG: two-component system, NarL family, sensor kinase, partial [Solirubrobacteraceae bacterium]|nr:two-component system, NarL family, sensor kinase [Solirubrobacteraceae bacterium]